MPPLARLLALCPAFLLAACVAAPAPPAPTAPAAVDPTIPALGAFALQPWLATDPAALIAALPPPPAALPEPPAPPADQGRLSAWREPASPWIEATLRTIVAEQADPLRAARTLMLVGVAINDALAAAAVARTRGVEVSDHAVASEAAMRTLTLAHPLRGEALAGLYAEGVWAGLWRGESGVQGVLNGQHLGAAVAAEVAAWAVADGSMVAPLVTAEAAPMPGEWMPTPPKHEPAQRPGWGRVRTMAIGEPSALRATAPPPWDSPAMAAEVAAFLAAQDALTAERRALAQSWAGGVGTLTPPGQWAQIAHTLVARHALPAAEAAAIYAALGVALHDAAVACWESKFHYRVARPIQLMQERNPAWRPLLNTPPHPSYPSGHGAFSGAASVVLGRAFPAAAAELERQAAEAARSRVDAGIHWPMDSAAGLEQGGRVGRIVVERLVARK